MQKDLRALTFMGLVLSAQFPNLFGAVLGLAWPAFASASLLGTGPALWNGDCGSGHFVSVQIWFTVLAAAGVLSSEKYAFQNGSVYQLAPPPEATKRDSARGKSLMASRTIASDFMSVAERLGRELRTRADPTGIN